MVILHCPKMAQRQRLVNIPLKAAPQIDGQREARKRETADAQMEKGEKDEHLKLNYINVASYHFILQKGKQKNIVKKLIRKSF